MTVSSILKAGVAINQKIEKSASEAHNFKPFSGKLAEIYAQFSKWKKVTRIMYGPPTTISLSPLTIQEIPLDAKS